jgi:PAS domain S-box-containing protein
MAHFDESADLPSGLKDLFERSKVSLSIADAQREDCPLVGVNAAFCELSGYEPDEVLGRNCRFLQPEQGAGPVRARMRRFIADSTARDGKFLIPNVTRDGEPFLNLVYMTKLEQNGRVRFVLGSQFAADLRKTLSPEVYDLALSQDLRQLKLLTDEHNWTVLGSFDALASSHSIIARAHMG